MAEPHPPIISVVGTAGSGKTTFMEKLVAELTRRGHRVATIKHSAERMEIDHPGKDTWRHARAGAAAVLLVSGGKLAMFRNREAEHSLDDLAAWLLPDADIVITEGFKKEGKPKIAIVRKEAGGGLVCAPADLLALVGDGDAGPSVPRFAQGDAAGVADLLEDRFSLKTGGARGKKR